MNILSPRRYKSRRLGPLSDAEIATRATAYALKDTSTPAATIDTAAREMAALISGPCWLVPIPSSTGDTRANAILAAAIAMHCPGAQVVKAIRRTQPIQSQCQRHKAGLGPIARDAHHFRSNGKSLALRQVYFVDNVTTSGNTMHAAREALGHGTGLVFADAGHRHNQPQPALL